MSRDTKHVELFIFTDRYVFAVTILNVDVLATMKHVIMKDGHVFVFVM